MEFARLRRLRNSQSRRELFAQTKISAKDLIMPYFVIEGKNKREAIKSLAGTERLSVDNLIKEIRQIKNLGVAAVLLFGIPRKKDFLGSESYSQNGIIQKAIRTIKKEITNMVIFSDVCLCGYTTYGHCGIIRSQRSEVRGQKKNLSSDFIDNDKTLKILAKIALSHAQAGVDFVAPSAMMDGQVKAIRDVLDKKGFFEVGILAYSAKYASNFYGPFRQALNSSAQFGDRKSYQMDYRNSDEALREIEQDIKEGADMVMVKPALAYLDIIYQAKQKFNVPLAAYNVSAEFAMVKAYCQKTEEEKDLVLEILTSIKRAGADLMITYHAKEAAKWLSN